MQDIFGNSFGDSELSEGPGLKQGKMRKPMPSPKGQVRGKGDMPFRSGKKGKNKGSMKKSKRRGGSASLKAVHKAASKAATPNPDDPGQQKKDKEAFRTMMKSGPKKQLKKKSDAGIGPSASSDKGEGGGRSSRGQGGKKSARRHFPFKRSANLGPGPRGRSHDETKCWKCKCGNVYSDGCSCVASGKGANCPDKGTIKKIKYKKDYKRTYNDEYHAWRAKQGGRVTQKLGATRTAL